ncbi:helix-turn-helix domain-containing protein [Flavobacterium terrigena]|uniref:Cro/C1-type HTH DNA-binding domain-containing protein n=1 Tax=Flavobacterium terrigena TaxID=402734 RepID=A0A1H6VYN5_9FLAO|nr:helix-turn-helix transcriptional regulator [Flavobacterium terrigena]SEJ09781.1 Cro/C1-type HTH DNA-binding domain-containing protein [Flavobacterium terrigena]
MLSFNLSPIFKARGIDKPHAYLVKAGISPHSAQDILNSQSRTLRLDHLELLCRILVCEPNDILVYREDATHKIAEDHPLNNLKQTETDKSLKETITTIPYKQLKELTKQINQTEVENK